MGSVLLGCCIRNCKAFTVVILAISMRLVFLVTAITSAINFI